MFLCCQTRKINPAKLTAFTVPCYINRSYPLNQPNLPIKRNLTFHQSNIKHLGIALDFYVWFLNKHNSLCKRVHVTLGRKITYLCSLGQTTGRCHFEERYNFSNQRLLDCVANGLPLFSKLTFYNVDWYLKIWFWNDGSFENVTLTRSFLVTVGPRSQRLAASLIPALSCLMLTAIACLWARS